MKLTKGEITILILIFLLLSSKVLFRVFSPQEPIVEYEIEEKWVKEQCLLDDCLTKIDKLIPIEQATSYLVLYGYSNMWDKENRKPVYTLIYKDITFVKKED